MVTAYKSLPHYVMTLILYTSMLLLIRFNFNLFRLFNNLLYYCLFFCCFCCNSFLNLLYRIRDFVDLPNVASFI